MTVWRFAPMDGMCVPASFQYEKVSLLHHASDTVCAEQTAVPRSLLDIGFLLFPGLLYCALSPKGGEKKPRDLIP